MAMMNRVLFGIACAMCAAQIAAAQQINRPWNFTQQNRAQMAIATKQLKDARSRLWTSTQALGATTIVCGGGASTATANNTCIVLNNATGDIVTDQISDDSNQDATSTAIETTSGADEVLSTLKGETD